MPIGAPELIIILVIALLILGPGKLPEVGSSLGKTIREFRKASTDIQDSVKIDTSPLPPTQAPAAPPVAPVGPVTPVETVNEPEIPVTPPAEPGPDVHDAGEAKPGSTSPDQTTRAG
jgi:sec-independent protein translocase protein TatA